MPARGIKMRTSERRAAMNQSVKRSKKVEGVSAASDED